MNIFDQRMERKIHIVYADDDEDDHVFFREAFDSINEGRYELSSVYDGAEVLDFLQHKGKYQSTALEPADLLILDLNMPLLDGFAIMKEMISNPRIKNIPVYVLSVSDKDADEKICRELGCAGFFTKPVNFKKLKEVILKILDHYNSNRKQ